MIHIYAPSEIEGIRRANEVVAKVLVELADFIKPGVSTLQINDYAEKIIRDAGARPAFLNYGEPPFPATVCSSVEDEVVHGIPRADRILKEGEIVSIDVGAELNGFYGDSARTYAVGTISEEKARLIRDTQRAFEAGMAAAKVGNRIGDISAAVQAVANEAGLGIVRDLTGHGIGRSLHEDPSIPNFGKAGRGPRLEAGMVLAIEPMLNLGTGRVTFDEEDGWTVRTLDGKPAAHYENTIAITAEGPVILSKLPESELLS